MKVDNEYYNTYRPLTRYDKNQELTLDQLAK